MILSKTNEIITPVTPVFYANKRAYESGWRVIANEGGSRSSKTYSLIQLFINIAIANKKIEITVCSPSLPHLKKGAMKDFEDEMDKRGIFDERNFNRTESKYYFDSGSYIEFFGAEEPGRLRGPARDILYINEANLIPRASYTQLSIRTRRTIFIDYNPADIYSWVYPLADAPGSKIIRSTYKNNRSNLTKEQIQDLEALKDIDENTYNVFCLGLRGTSTETIYTHFKECDHLPMKGELFMGQDFGYNVASALVLMELYEDALYIDEMLYETKLSTSDLIERYKSLDISKTIEIFCDAAEPKTIKELCNAGYNAISADKDVTEGIRCVKGTKVYITRRSANINKERISYKWKVNKDGVVLDEPVKFNDHSMDAIRYGAFTKMHIGGYSWGALG